MSTQSARKFFQPLAASFLLVFSAATGFAQSDLTGVAGTIHDPTGAVVSGATVTIRNQATGVERKATTSANGNYSITSMPAGAVTLIVEAPGVKRVWESRNNLQGELGPPMDGTLN